MRQHVPVCLVALALLAGCVGENPAVPEVPPDTRMPVALDYRAHLILHPPPALPQGRVDPVDTRPDSAHVYGPESRLEPGPLSQLRGVLASLRAREPQGAATFLGLYKHRHPQRAAAVDPSDDVSAEDVKLDPDAVKSTEGGYQLNFDNADIKDVLHAVLGNALGISYSVAPNINGRITISSSAPQNRAELLSTLESALAMQGLSMIPTGSGYRIAPSAAGGGAVDTTGKQPGFGISVVPLEYSSAASVMKLLNGFVSDNDGVRVDTARNAVVIRGPEPRRAEIVRAVTNFDADWMHSQSVSVIQLRRSQPGEIVSELNDIFDADANGGSAAGVIQFKPIKRMRAVMVITRNDQLLKRADSWIRRLDHQDTSATPGVYIYRPRYREARELVRLVNGLFGTGSGSGGGPSGSVSFSNEGGFAGADEPRLDTSPQNRVVGQSSSSFAGNLTSGGFAGGGGANAAGGFANSSGGGGISFGGGGGNSAGARGAAPGGPAGNLADPIEAGRDTGGGAKAKLSITADTGNNTIVAYTDGETYRKVNAVLRQLDVAPLQVAINVTVAEVALNDALRYGVQFYLNNQPGQIGVVESANTILSEVSSIRSLAQPGGFGLLGGIGGLGGSSSISQDVILSALDSVSKVHILSNPSLVVMENKPATFEVGNQVPVTTQQATSTIAAEAPTLNQVQYLDTGVILKIIPRVGQKGEVDMDLDQIISAVVPDPSGSPTLTPTISKRRVASNISVASGQSVMLAGLIQDQRQKARGQLPFAGAVGDLFGNTDNQFTRTELVIFIRPTIIRGGRDAQAVAENFRGGLRNMDLHAPAVAKQ